MAVEGCLLLGLRSVTSSNCALWDAITMLEGESTPTVAAVLAATRVTSALARVRAWIRVGLNTHTIVPSVVRLASPGAANHRAAYYTDDALLRDPEAIARFVKLLEATQGLRFALRVDDPRLERTGNTASSAEAEATGVVEAGGRGGSDGGIEAAVDRSVLEAASSLAALGSHHSSSSSSLHRISPAAAAASPSAPLAAHKSPSHSFSRPPPSPAIVTTAGAAAPGSAAMMPLHLPTPHSAAPVPAPPPSARSRAGSALSGADLTTPAPARSRGMSFGLLGSSGSAGRAATSAGGAPPSSSLLGSIMSTASGLLASMMPTLSTLTGDAPGAAAVTAAVGGGVGLSSDAPVASTRGHGHDLVLHFHVPLAAAVLDRRHCTHAMMDSRLSVPTVVHRIAAWLMAAPEALTRSDAAGLGAVSMQLDAVRELAARYDAADGFEGVLPPPAAARVEDCHLVANLLTFFCLALPQAPIPDSRWESLLACGDLPHAETHQAAVDGVAGHGSSGSGSGGTTTHSSPRLRNLRSLLRSLPVEHRALLAEVLPLYAWMAGVRYTDSGAPALDASVLMTVQVLADAVGTALARPPGIVGAQPAPPLAPAATTGSGSVVMAATVNQLCAGVTARMASADVERLGRVVATLLLHWRWVLADVLAERERFYQQLVATMRGVTDCHDALVTAVAARDVRHQMLLRRLWEASAPAVAVSTAVDTDDFTPDASTMWRAIGFEHAAPAIDLANICLEPRQPPGAPRGSGLLGLQTLVYVAERYNERWSRMLASLHGVKLRRRGSSVGDAAEAGGGGGASQRAVLLRHAASAPEAGDDDGGGSIRHGASGRSHASTSGGSFLVVDADEGSESGGEASGEDVASAPPSPIATVSWYPLASAALITIRRLAEACYLAGVRVSTSRAAPSPDHHAPPADTPAAAPAAADAAAGSGGGGEDAAASAAARAAPARGFFSPIKVAHGLPDFWTLCRVAAGQAVAVAGGGAATAAGSSSGLALEVAPSEAFLALAGLAMCILHERWAAGSGILRDMPVMVDEAVADTMALLPDLVGDALAGGARGYLEAPAIAELAPASGLGTSADTAAPLPGAAATAQHTAVPPTPFDVVTALGRWRRRAELAGTLPVPVARTASRPRGTTSSAPRGGSSRRSSATSAQLPAAAAAIEPGADVTAAAPADGGCGGGGGGGGSSGSSSARKSARTRALLASAMSPGGTTLHTVDASLLRLLPATLLPSAALAESSGILSSHQAALLEAVLPRSIRGYEWVKVYALTRHGAVLDTLISRSREHGSTLLVMRDDAGTVFGGYVSEPWAPPRNGGFYGNGQAFVFTFADRRAFDAERAATLESATREEGDAIRFALRAATHGADAAAAAAHSPPAGGAAPPPALLHVATPHAETPPAPSPEAEGGAPHPNFSVYRWTRRNKYFQTCNSDGIGMGGGGSFAWYLDSDLCGGSTGRCETYLSPPLAHAERFTVLELEVWGFHRRLHFTAPAAAAAAATALPSH